MGGYYNNNLTGKVFLRLALFVALYTVYFSAFNYFSNTNLSSSDSWLPSTSPVTPPTKQKKYTNILCNNSNHADELMQNFLPLHTQQIDNIGTNGKFIIYTAIEETGLGNRIPPLVSSFMLALLTNRGFLVHWPHVNESVNLEQEHIGMVSFSSLFKPPFLFDGALVPGFYDLITEETTVVVSIDVVAELLLCGDIEKEWGSFRFLVIYGWRPFFDLLFQNSMYQEKIKELGLQDLLHEIAECLLQPIPEVYEIIQNFEKESNMGANTKLVGIHIRKLSKHGLTDAQETALWDCIREKYPPPPLLPFDPSFSNQNASILYFLASDSPDSIVRAPADFRPYVVTIRGDMIRHNVEGLARALADMWILGRCVEMYGAQGTTFLAAVRTLFNISTNILLWSSIPSPTSSSTSSSTPSSTASSLTPPLSSHALCARVPSLPCFKWWDVFRTRKEFSLSCFIQHAPRKPNFLC